MMSKQFGSGIFGRIMGARRAKTPRGERSRRLAFESLEIRRLLTSAPTAIAFQPQTGQGTATLTAANNSAATAAAELQFLVSGVTAGNTVYVYADGGTTAIATGVVQTGNTTITVTTSGNSTLSNGPHTFTAKQVDTSSNASVASPGTTVQVFSGLTITMTTSRAVSATVGGQFTYTFTVQNNAPNGDTVTYALPTTGVPSGMTYSVSTKTVTWTPTTDLAGTTQSFALSATDTAGNTSASLPVFVSVAAANGLTVVAPAGQVAVGSPVLVGFKNSNSGSNYTVMTSSTSDPTGSHLTATILPATNPVLKIVTDRGEMDFQLFNNYTPNTVKQIKDLVSSGAFDPSKYATVKGTFGLEVGRGTGAQQTAAITFDSTNLTTTAANIQSALRAVGFTGATVSVVSGTAARTYSFQVTFASGQSPLYYVGGEIPVTFANSVTSAAATQVITFVTVPTFYRVISTFMNQGGISGVGNVSPIPVELNSNLRFTSSGLLAMANNGVDGNTSEFFVTNPNDMNNGFLDFRYTIFGKLISGDNVRADIASDPVETNSSGETSAPLTPPQILSMTVDQQTTGGGVIQLNATSGAQGPYTVTLSDGTNTQTFHIEAGTDSTTSTAISNQFDPPNPWVKPINGTDKIVTSANTPATFTPQTGSADGTAVQVAVQPMLSLTSLTGAYTDNSFLGTSYVANYPVQNPNPHITVTQNGSSYTVTPANGFYGMQVIEVMGFTPVSGTFQLKVNTTTTSAITFDSTNLTATAANIQSALRAAGFSGATVSVANSTSAPEFRFNVTFSGSEANIAYVAASTALPITFANTATAASAAQTLTFSATGASWDANSGVNPVYRAFVPVYVTPPTPVLSSITSGGKTITGSTFNNNGSTGTELSFNISGVVTGATVGVYVDGSTTPLVTGTVSSGTTITLTPTGDNAHKIADGAHTFTVKQTIATSALTLYGGWTENGPAAQFPISAGSVDSAASSGVQLTIGLFVLATPLTKARVGALYAYTVQTNAPAGDTITVTPVTMPSGMTFDNVKTFSWAPSSSQLNTSPTFQALVTDAQGRSTTIGPLSITVVIGLTPTQVPINSAGGNVTVSFIGGNVQVFDNIANVVLSNQSFKSTDSVEIDLPAGQANTVVVALPSNHSAAIPQQVFVNGASTSTNNQVTVNGTATADSFTTAGNKVTANGLQVVSSNVQKLTLTGNGGNNYYTLNSSAIPLTIANSSGQGTLDFSNDTAGVAVNLGLYRGQSQYITPWNTTLALSGVLSELIGTAYADTLTGGPAAITIIHSGRGNDTLIGGSGDNILVGGGGTDVLRGGYGRNLLICGSGAGTVYANGNSNMVFGGTTNYDNNDQALIGLLNEGPRMMYSYTVRRALATAKKTPAALSGMLKFQDNSAHNTIFGSGANNWYVAGKYGVVKPR